MGIVIDTLIIAGILMALFFGLVFGTAAYKAYIKKNKING